MMIKIVDASGKSEYTETTWKLQVADDSIQVKSTDLITLFFQTRLNKWLYMMSFAAFRRFTFPQINKYYLNIKQKNNNHIYERSAWEMSHIYIDFPVHQSLTHLYKLRKHC